MFSGKYAIVTSVTEVSRVPKFYAPRGVIPSGKINTIHHLEKRGAYFEILSDFLEKEYLDMFLPLVNFQSKWIEENLGINIENRLTEANKPTPAGIRRTLIHRTLLHDEGEDWDTVKFLYGKKEDVAGLAHVHIRSKIHIRRPNDKETLEHIFGHEHIHVLTGQVFDIKHEDISEEKILVGGVPLLAGYENYNSKTFNIFSEALTEMMNIEMLHAYHKASTNGANQEPEDLFYGAAVIAFDAIFQEAATRLGVSYKTLRHNLYKGMLTADMTQIRSLVSAFGKEEIRRIARADLSSFRKYGTVKTFVEGFGVTEQVAERLNQAKEGGVTQILGDVDVAIKK